MREQPLSIGRLSSSNPSALSWARISPFTVMITTACTEAFDERSFLATHATGA